MGRVSVLRELEKTWGAVSGVDAMDERERRTDQRRMGTHIMWMRTLMRLT